MSTLIVVGFKKDMYRASSVLNRLLEMNFAMFAGIASYRYFERWWAVLLEGVAGVVIGLLTFFWPNITALVLMNTKERDWK